MLSPRAIMQMHDLQRLQSAIRRWRAAFLVYYWIAVPSFVATVTWGFTHLFSSPPWMSTLVLPSALGSLAAATIASTLAWMCWRAVMVLRGQTSSAFWLVAPCFLILPMPFWGVVVYVPLESALHEQSRRLLKVEPGPIWIAPITCASLMGTILLPVIPILGVASAMLSLVLFPYMIAKMTDQAGKLLRATLDERAKAAGSGAG